MFRKNAKKIETHIRVQGGAHEHEGQVFPLQDQVPQNDDEEIRVHRPLVHLLQVRTSKSRTRSTNF